MGAALERGINRRHGRKHVAAADREILMQADPEVFFITDHYRDYPWVLVRFATVEPGALPDLLERAWRLVAPKTLLAKHDIAS